MTTNAKAIVLGPGEGEQAFSFGVPVTFKVTGKGAGGAYALWEDTIEKDQGPALHIHEDAEEAFYILEGELKIEMGENTITAAAGSFILIPRGMAHAFRNEKEAPAKQLVIVSPPGFEGFLRETDGSHDVEKAAVIASKYHMKFPNVI